MVEPASSLASLVGAVPEAVPGGNLGELLEESPGGILEENRPEVGAWALAVRALQPRYASLPPLPERTSCSGAVLPAEALHRRDPSSSFYCLVVASSQIVAVVASASDAIVVADRDVVVVVAAVGSEPCQAVGTLTEVACSSYLLAILPFQF